MGSTPVNENGTQLAFLIMSLVLEVISAESERSYVNT